MPTRLAAALLALALLLAACAGEGEDAAPTTPTAPTAAAVDDGGEQAETVDALWWSAETVADGAPFDAADLSGGDVVLWMWAPWCTVCNAEAPDVARALADLPDDVTVIGVAGRDDVEPMRAFIAEHGLQDMTHVVDADGSVWSSYGISYQPAWVFIGSDGSTAVAAGALGYDGLFAALDEVFPG